MADLIERHKITANLPSVMMNYCNRFNSKQIESITEMIYELENSIESADVQTIRRGRWITITNERGSDTICSRCYKTMVVMRTDFCPTCGADMRGEENG